MKKPEKTVITEESNIVKDFFIGGTHVIIADNYCKNKTSEYIKETLSRIAEIAENSFRNKKNEPPNIGDIKHKK